MKSVLKVEGMTCGHCKMTVEKALKGVSGVSSALVNLENKSVTVEYDGKPETMEKAKQAIVSSGYEVVA